MTIEEIFQKALQLEFLSAEEGLFLYGNAGTSDLIFVANELRKKKVPGNDVGWIIDRNVNITNVCYCGCRFCNFSRKINSDEAFITSIDDYRKKIDEMISLGGNQLLLQGGCHPKLNLGFYLDLFRTLKTLYPTLRLHALSPPEIVHLSKMSGLNYSEVLQQLVEAGLDSLPGAGAEILVDRVRNLVSPAKCSSQQWLDVMRQAHLLNLTTSATMMFGHIETHAERIEHLLKLRSLQAESAGFSNGFTTFIPWPFQGKDTWLSKNYSIHRIDAEDYIRTLAISRIILVNIKNIQASWLTVGIPVAQICLHSGANDMGSIMIEENVVSSAGAGYKIDEEGIKKAIREAGFIARRRNQKYEFIDV